MASVSISSILVPVDFSDASRAALEYALFLRERFDAAIEVVHAWESPIYAGAEGIIARDDDGERRTLADIVQRHARMELEVFLRDDVAAHPRLRAHLVEGHAHAAVLRIAKDHHHDLIVLGTHGRHGVARLFLGSVAERVVREASCPVITVHASGAPK